jgi:2-octaprenyl-6-methoxyphenol hydroxylase
MLIDFKQLPSHCDITIIGGGPVGMFTALRLAQSGYRVLVVEAQNSQPDTARTLALSWHSAQALQQLQAWDSSATAIAHIHISQAHSVGRILLHAADIDLPALGYIVRYNTLCNTLHHALQHTVPDEIAYVAGAAVTDIQRTARYAQLTLQSEQQEHKLSTRLVIVADGGKAATLLNVARQVKDYRQVAIVSTVKVASSHQQTAYERFSTAGSIALLPDQHNFALIWTQTLAQAVTSLQLSEDAFLNQLRLQFQGRTPHLSHVGQRLSIPLFMTQLTQPYLPRCVFIGNAAQTLHPVAGQGLNLGLRDAMTLSRLLIHSPKQELGEVAQLQRYHQQRKLDTRLMLGFTDGLVNYFGQEKSYLKPLRSLGLSLIEQYPLLRAQLEKKMVFGFV